jgi:hypothetical protein
MITKVYFFITTGGTRTFYGLHVLMAQSTITTLTSGAFYPGPWDTVYRNSLVTLSCTSNSWFGIQLDKPFIYDNTKSLVVFVGQCASIGDGMAVRQNTLSNIRRVWSVGACPYIPYPGGDGAIVNFGVDVAPIVPPYYNFNTGGNANSFPLNQVPGKMVQWLVLGNEFNQPAPALSGGSMTGFYCRIASGNALPVTTYSRFYVLLGQTTVTSLTTGQFYSGPMDTVYKRSSVTLSAPADSWLFFPFDHAFSYDPARSLVIQMEQCGAPGVTGYSLAHTNLSGNRRVWSQTSIPCPWTPYSGTGANVLNCGIILRYPVGTTGNNSEIPNAYSLSQNYPNPFNPATTISFAIPKAGNVELRVYDVLGREASLLVNEFKAAGSYSVDFDASELSSGVYYYTIRSGDFTQTKKMVLIK